MKILYITPSFQHPTVRGPHRHYYFIRELSKRHEITLLTLARHHVNSDALSEMKSYTRELHLFDVNGGAELALAKSPAKLPVVGERLKGRAVIQNGLRQMKERFQHLLQINSFDVVLFHGKSMFPVIEDCSGLPLVVDFCDATSMRIREEMKYASPMRRPWLLWRLKQMRRIESRLIAKTPFLAFVSLRDRNAAQVVSDRAKVVPIGVDSQYWKRKNHHYDSNCIIFTGVMDYGPNHDAAVFLIEKILPMLREKQSHVEVLLVGRAPRPELIEIAKRAGGVTVTGAVEDLRPHLERAAAFVAPLRYASGTQNKLLEAMAMEVPVITTGLSADGLYVEGGDEPPVLRADDESQFVEAIGSIFENSQLRARLAKHGREYVESHFNWLRSAEILESLCAAAVNGK